METLQPEEKVFGSPCAPQGPRPNVMSRRRPCSVSVRSRGHDMPWQACPRPSVPHSPNVENNEAASDTEDMKVHHQSSSSSCQVSSSSSIVATQSNPVAWVRALRQAAMSLESSTFNSQATQLTDEEKAQAKAKAVAALQKFFFEELAKGEDANGAAAIALRRLTEQASLSSTLTVTPRNAETVQEDSSSAPSIVPIAPSIPRSKLGVGEGRRPNPFGARRIMVQS